MKAKRTIVFKDGYAVGFKMAIAECFRDSIKKKVFKTGDIIYNDKRAYLSPWSKAIKHVEYAFRVISMEGKNIKYETLIRAPKNKSLKQLSVVLEPIKDFIEKLRTGIEPTKTKAPKTTQIDFKLT